MRETHLNYKLEAQDDQKVTLEETIKGKKTLVVFLRHLG
jgi:hypothetical protein